MVTPAPDRAASNPGDARASAGRAEGASAVGAPVRQRRRPARRLSGEQRRAELLEAAVIEFAENGYHGTRTADIAARAGVSQPYVYALFPDKRALFLAAHDWTTEQIKETLEKASTATGNGDGQHDVLARAYAGLRAEHPHQVLFQVQAHAAATADPVIREPVRERFMQLIELTERLHDAPREVVLQHVARAMLTDVALALDLPAEYRPEISLFFRTGRGDSHSHRASPIPFTMTLGYPH